MFKNKHKSRFKTTYKNIVWSQTCHWNIPRFIEDATANIPDSGFKVDGILISGKTDQDHLANLEKVFRVLKEIVAMLKQKFMHVFLPKR